MRSDLPGPAAPSDWASVRVIVRGFVQGVGFRYFVEKVAASLGVEGYVRNLGTGEVEVVAEGNRSGLEELVRRAREGPRASQVDDVDVQWGDFRGDHHGFRVRF